MGQQSRIKKARREARAQLGEGPVLGSVPIRILRGIHRTIQQHCGENGRRCWEYLLEMLAHSTGWKTESAESQHLWDKMADETRWAEFFESWMAEVEWAKRNGAPFSEPLGELLEEIEGTNSMFGQFMTPMSVVRMMNQITMHDSYEPPDENGMPRRRALEPACGTGRFMIDALVHDDGILMHGVDLDLWMLRTAMLNVRMLAKWTSLRLNDPEDRLKPLRRARRMVDSLIDESNSMINPLMRENPPDMKGGDVLMIGGRSIFMHGDALIVDLNYTPNWLCAGWAWGPRPWQSNLKIDGYYGSYNQWIEDGRPPLGQAPKVNEVQFDYSMDRKPRHAP